jgi:lipopolysaccharide assembly protein A
MRILAWALRAFLFFTLFAFALNNQHTVTVNWFFGLQWQAPMVMVVLLALGLGAVLGVVAMVPNWWRARRWGSAAMATLQSGPPAPVVSTSSPKPNDAELGALGAEAAHRFVELTHPIPAATAPPRAGGRGVEANGRGLGPASPAAHADVPAPRL